MKLLEIKVENFRSIVDETFAIEKIEDGSLTFTLIGVNESGKSSLLKAISLIEKETIQFPQDYFDEKKAIKITLCYELRKEDINELNKVLEEKSFDKELIEKLGVNKVTVSITFDPAAGVEGKIKEEIEFKNEIFKDYTLIESKPTKKDPTQEQEDFNVKTYFEANLPEHFWSNAPEVTFWKSSDKYLINEPINLDTFSQNPEETSVPLRNCFNLAGIVDKDISGEIEKVRANSLSHISDLQDKLADSVTGHIKKIWPDHPIKIKFQINSMMLSFLIEDEGVKYNSKTTSQRSDGFKQFVSFLLSVSAESTSGLLYNSILLLDEPETHLHPQAQEYLKNELIKLTKNNNNNVVIFATHSNYMIDKDNLDRCFRMSKKSNGITKMERIMGKVTSYSEVNFEVFNIPTTDYHNELYGYLEDVKKDKLDNLPKTKKWKNKKTNNTEDVSLATYIRHSIHHPENSLNQKFSEKELLASIETLRKLKFES